MKHIRVHNGTAIFSIPARLMTIGIIILLFLNSAWAGQFDSSKPPSDFMNSDLAIKTATGSLNLSIRLVDFLMGIETDKTWVKRSDTLWVLETSFKDPVIDAYKSYFMEFEKVDTVVILSKVSFNNRILSNQEMRSFANQIVENFGKHLSPK
jgi:hypothetical protein